METNRVSRRDFLRAGAATAAAAGLPTASTLAADESPDASMVPMRPLGKTGVKVSMLNQGAAVKGLAARHLNIMKAEGIRYIDTADCYPNSELVVGQWLLKQKRGDFFLVSKDHPKSPEQWIEMLDKRLETLQTDYLDLYLIHCFGDKEYRGQECVKWLKSKEWAAAVEKMKKSGKTKFVGFSSHCAPVELRAELLTASADGSWVDAIMVANDPALVKANAVFNKALDACYKAGVGLISMKECRAAPVIAKEIVPEFEAMGLTPYGAILSAVWSDERFASICSHMDNITKLKENVATAKSFKPLKPEQLGAVIDFLEQHARTYCVGCDGSCKMAGKTTAELGDIARYLSYYEQQGDHAQARKLFAALPPEARDLSNIDVEAASRACKSHLDFARIVRHAREKLA